MKKTFLLLALVIGSTACQPQHQAPVLNPADYESYLKPVSQQVSQSFAEKELRFWQQKLDASPGNNQYLIQLAGAYSQKFREDGNIDHIHTSDDLYKQALVGYGLDKAGIYRALTANAITRHSFREAYDLIYKAIEIGSDQGANHLLLFDVALELGLYNEAQRALESQMHQSTFSYLIRASKMADHKGDLDKAITLMEQAYEKKKNDPTLFQWAKSNLGDMYGHAGWVADSYQAYLEVLVVNPNHWRSWQGLAWIAYAHEGDLWETRRIINHLSEGSSDPQISLLLADLTASAGDGDQALKWKQQFHDEASQTKYGQMYNKHLALLEAEDLGMAAEAITRLEKELELRPTPEVYDALAWSHFANGDHEQALKLVSLHVENKTFEPDALYHLGIIYWHNGQQRKGRKYLKEALKAKFELGPLTTKSILETLAN